MEGIGDWVVRPAGPEELDEVGRLRVAFVADVRGVSVAELGGAFADATDRFVRDRVAAGRMRSWFAEDVQAGLVGIVSLLDTDVAPLPEDLLDRDGYLINMYVVPEARGRGVARALLADVLADAEARGLRRVHLHFTEEGRPLYEQAGFQPDVRGMYRPVGPPNRR